MVWFIQEQPDKNQNIRLTTLLPDQVNLIELNNNSGQTIRLERETTGWMMTIPSTAKANDTMVNNLLEIAGTKSIRRFKAPDDLTEFGLNPPNAILILNHTRIEMGAIHPMNQRRYMRVGNIIHLINDRFPHLLRAAPQSYITPQRP